jgi:hypothetical protein
MVAYNPSSTFKSPQVYKHLQQSNPLTASQQPPSPQHVGFTPTISKEFSDMSLASMAREDPDISRLTDKFLALRKKQGQSTVPTRWTLCQRDTMDTVPKTQSDKRRWVKSMALRISSMEHVEAIVKASASLDPGITGDKARTWITTLFVAHNVHSGPQFVAHQTYNHMAFKMCTAASAPGAVLRPWGCP